MLFYQGLVNARKNEIETENHMLQIAQREEGRLQQEIQKLEKDLEEIKEKKNVFEVNYFTHFNAIYFHNVGVGQV